MKTNSLTLAFALLTLVGMTSCAAHSTLADRMPVAAAVVSDSLDVAEQELDVVCAEYETLSLTPEATEILEGVARGIRSRLAFSRGELSSAQTGLDLDALKRASSEVGSLFRDVQSLRTMTIVADAATVSR